MRKEWLESDYYATLGVASDASAKEIKQAYRKLAQKYHPDKTAGDVTAETRFKEVNEAYEVLGDAETRKEYDHARQMGYFVGGPGGGQQYVRVEDLMGGGRGSPFDLLGGLGDLLGRQPGSRPRGGEDLSAEMHLSFHDAISGTTRQVTVTGQTIKVKIPKVRAKTGEAVTFRSALVPPYVRKTQSLEVVLPWLYLKGISSGEMEEALKVLVGEQAQGLSASTVSRV